jgi:hypothetical protein
MNNTVQQLVANPHSNQYNPNHPFNTLTFSEAWECIFQGKISKDKLYSEVRAGRIPHLRVGTKILYVPIRLLGLRSHSSNIKQSSPTMKKRSSHF